MGGDLGDKLGPRLAALIGRYTLAARRDHAPLEAKIRAAGTQAVIDKAGHEIADHLRPMIERAIAANPDMDPAVKDYLTKTASGRHQLQAVAGSFALGAAGGVLGTIISNELAPFVNAAIMANPHLRLDPQTAAIANAKQLLDYQGMLNEGAAAGLDQTRMTILGEAAQAVPDSATIGDLLNRGLIDHPTAAYWIARGGYGTGVRAALLDARAAVLSPADAALAVLKGVISTAEGASIAAKSGVSAADFAILLGDTGEPPAAQELGEALRRGFIDPARFTHGIRQSRIRDEWIDVLLALRYQPMSTADAVDAAVQGHLPIAEAHAKAQQNGLEPGDFDALYQTAGEPLSRTEMEQLYNRGRVDKAAVEQAIRESRVKNKYIGDAFALHERLPEGRQVVAMITHGAVSKAEGLKLLMHLGYSEQIAGYLVAEGVNTKLGAHKDLTVAEIRQLYVAGVFTAAHVTELLAHLGYDAPESAALIKGWNLLAAAAITRQAIGAVRSKYVSRHITATQAKADLEQLNVGGVARDRYLQIWDIELSAAAAVLSEAQVVHAHKTALITGQDAYDRLLRKGYSPGDAHILLGVKPSDPVPA